MEHPPLHPPPGGDGDWALLGHIIGLASVCAFLVVVVIGAVVLRWLARRPRIDASDD